MQKLDARNVLFWFEVRFFSFKQNFKALQTVLISYCELCVQDSKIQEKFISCTRILQDAFTMHGYADVCENCVNKNIFIFELY